MSNTKESKNYIPDKLWDGSYGEGFSKSLHSYENTFGQGQAIFHNQLEYLFSEPNHVIIDLGSPADSLATLIEERKPRHNFRALAVGLEDLRDVAKQGSHEQLGVDYITGDLNKLATWLRVKEWLKDDHAHLVIERMWGGLSNMRSGVGYYNRVKKAIWSCVDPNGGVMALQYHGSDYFNSIDMRAWFKKLKELRNTKGLKYNIFPDTCSIVIKKEDSSVILPDITV